MYLFVSLVLLITNSLPTHSFVDDPFLQPISKKYLLEENEPQLEMKKLVVDRDDNVYALTNEGVYIIIDNRFVRDRRHHPLTDLVPLDITLQSNTGVLYYLYEDNYLSNAYAGTPYGEFEKGRYSHIAVNKSGDVFLAGASHIKLFRDGSGIEHAITEEIRSAKSCGEVFYVQTNTGISKYSDGRLRQVVDEPEIEAWTFGNDELFISIRDGYYSVSTADWEQKRDVKTKIPVTPITSMAYRHGTLWAGTEKGMFSTENFNDYRYFASLRWLASDQVIDTGVDSNGNAFALTEEGISEVRYKSMTLHKKAQYFYDKIRKRHLRLGLIGEVRLENPGDLSTAEMIDTDNDGLWTAFYMGSEIFRYAVTQDPEARSNALETFMSYERLLSLNPLDGFPSRTFERKGFSVADPDRWRESHKGNWEWKGHTSSDEFVAYIWVAGLMSEFLDLNPDEMRRVAGFIDEIMMHIINNDYYFVDIDGEPTTWGRWNPEYINMYPESVVDRKLGSLTITAGLQLAYELTGKELYKEEAYRLFEEHGYLDNIKIPMDNIGYTEGVYYKGHNMGSAGWNHSDDEMAFLSYWILYHFAFDEELKNTYADVITDHWKIEKPERNALWSMISYGTSGVIDLPSVKWHLREFQMDMVRWDVKNSHRGDLEFMEDNFRNQTTKELLPPGERMTIRHNANPFILDGGRGGLMELAGDEYLLPYWMGRYLKVIIDP